MQKSNNNLLIKLTNFAALFVDSKITTSEYMRRYFDVLFICIIYFSSLSIISITLLLYIIILVCVQFLFQDTFAYENIQIENIIQSTKYIFNIEIFFLESIQY